jgi:hypothetical protein
MVSLKCKGKGKGKKKKQKSIPNTKPPYFEVRIFIPIVMKEPYHVHLKSIRQASLKLGLSYYFLYNCFNLDHSNQFTKFFTIVQKTSETDQPCCPCVREEHNPKPIKRRKVVGHDEIASSAPSYMGKVDHTGRGGEGEEAWDQWVGWYYQNEAEN